MWKSIRIKLASGKRTYQLPQNNGIGSSKVKGLWVRENGKTPDGDAIASIADAHLTLQKGKIIADNIPLGIVAACNYQKGAPFPIDLDAIEWESSAVVMGAVDAQNDGKVIELIFEYE